VSICSRVSILHGLKVSIFPIGNWRRRYNSAALPRSLWYLKNGASYGQSYYRTLIWNHTQSIEWCDFRWPWVTSNQDFKVTTFSTLNISETTRDRAIVTIGSRMHFIEWWHFQWHWRTVTRFSRSQQFWSRISQKRCVLGIKLLLNSTRKSYKIHRMVPLSMTLSDRWRVFQGHDIFRQWISKKRHEIEP